MKIKSLFFTNSSSFATIATIFCLWLTVYLSDAYQEVLGYFLILSVGILHGANDLQLLMVAYGKNTFGSSNRLLRNYIILVLLVGLSFFVVPKIALIMFVLLSSYHFGEQHWHDKVYKGNFITIVVYTTYGLTIFSLLFYLNPLETNSVIYGITGVKLSIVHFRILFYSLASLFLISVTISVIKNYIRARIFEELFLLIVFLIIFRVAALIWAFAIYFIFWHSLPSLLDQIKILYGKPNLKSVKNYIASSFLYWILAIIGLSSGLYFFGTEKEVFLPVFFSFLAAITLPHVLVMHKVMHQ